MAAAAFIEPLPVIEFVAQLLGKDVLSRQLSDADRIKVLPLPFLIYYLLGKYLVSLTVIIYYHYEFTEQEQMK